MNKNRIKQERQKSRARLVFWIPMVLLLLTMVATGVLAQEGDTPDDDGLTFEQGLDPIARANAKAANDEVWLPPSKDSFVASNDPNRNYGFDTLMRFGFSQSELGATRPLFKYKVEAYLPSDAKITKAELHVYMTAIRDSDSSRGYAAHSLSSAWDEGSVTWNNSPGYGSEIGRGTLGTYPGWQVTDITNEVKEWLKNPDKNKGIILIGDERPDQSHERDYYTKEATSTGLTPRLYVQFDVNTDDVAPVANVVQPSAGAWSPDNFVVKWEGYDPPNSDGSPGSGIRWYDVFYTTNGGSNWDIGRAQVTGTETNVTGGAHKQSVGLYARARDNAGNEGPSPSGSGSIQTWTRIDAEAPNATMNPLPEFSGHSSFPISWQDTKEGSESGIRYYDVQYREEEGEWQQYVYHTTSTSTTFNRGENGVTYEFRARGVDNVGNEQAWSDDAQAITTVWLTPVAYIEPFDAPAIYQELDGPSQGDGFAVSWVGLTPPGTSIVSFDVRFQRPGNTSWLAWKTDTQQTTDKFELSLNDPDGIYRFQVRATNNEGVTGPYLEEGEARMIVDRLEPFMEPQTYMPLIISN